MAAVKSVGVTGQTPEGAHYYYSGFITRKSKCLSQVFQIKSPADNISAGTPRYAANINNILWFIHRSDNHAATGKITKHVNKPTGPGPEVPGHGLQVGKEPTEGEDKEGENSPQTVHPSVFCLSRPGQDAGLSQEAPETHKHLTSSSTNHRLSPCFQPPC